MNADMPAHEGGLLSAQAQVWSEAESASRVAAGGMVLHAALWLWGA